jgi:hypothetical protein
VVHLDEHSIVAQVRYGRPTNRKSRNSQNIPVYESLLAPVSIECGRVGDQNAFLKTVLIWPHWTLHGGLPLGEAVETSRMLLSKNSAVSLELIAGGIVIMPSRGDNVEEVKVDNVIYLTLGASGKSLKDGLAQLRQALIILLEAGASS